MYYPITKDGEMIPFGTYESFKTYLFVKGEDSITSDTVVYALAYDATYGIYRYPQDVTNRVSIIVPFADLVGSYADSSDFVTVGEPAMTYFKIPGKTLNGMPLYTRVAGPISSTSTV